MLKVYAQVLPDVPYVPLLYPNLGPEHRENILFLNRAFRFLTRPLVEIVSDPAKADYVLLAHNMPTLKGHQAFVTQQADLAERHGKQMIIFWHGDSDAEVEIPRSVVFRTSQYRGSLRGNEIMMPAYAEDLLEEDGLHIRTKHEGKPVAGFCGWAEYKSTRNRVGTMIKNALIDLTGGNPARKKGLWYRMRAIEHLQSSESVTTNFIIRSSYSGHQKTIRIDPAQARGEYRKNMVESDFALVVKGDGNYSYRFYEALSLGRVPLLLDTDCILPLEDILDYKTFVISVSYSDLDHMGAVLAEHFTSLTEDEFASMQRQARDAFENHLRVDRFLEFAMGILEKRLGT